MKYALLFIVSACLLAFGCQEPPDLHAIPKTFDYGHMEKGVYKNDFFECEVTLPETWYFVETAKAKEFMKTGMNMINADPKEVERVEKIADVTTANLVIAYKIDPEKMTPDDDNESFIMMAEKLPANVKITPQRYTQICIQNIKKLSKNMACGKVFKKTLGGKEFFVLPVEMVLPEHGITVKQHYYFHIKNDYAFTIICTLPGDSESDIPAILSSFRMK